jgi:hypothetical protein
MGNWTAFFDVNNTRIREREIMARNQSNENDARTNFEKSYTSFLNCLEEIQFTIPEFFLLRFMCEFGVHLPKNDLIRIARHRKFKYCWRPNADRPSTDELQTALDRLVKSGYVVHIDSYHLETIHRLLDMCQIKIRGFLPVVGDYDATPKGFSVYFYVMETVDDVSYINEYDGIVKENKKIIHVCAPTLNKLKDVITNNLSLQRLQRLHPEFYNLSNIESEYCGPWCRRWWKIIPKGYLCRFPQGVSSSEIDEQNIQAPEDWTSVRGVHSSKIDEQNAKTDEK